MGGFQETVSISPDGILFIKTLAFRITLKCHIENKREQARRFAAERGIATSPRQGKAGRPCSQLKNASPGHLHDKHHPAAERNIRLLFLAKKPKWPIKTNILLCSNLFTHVRRFENMYILPHMGMHRCPHMFTDMFTHRCAVLIMLTCSWPLNIGLVTFVEMQVRSSANCSCSLGHSARTFKDAVAWKWARPEESRGSWSLGIPAK